MKIKELYKIYVDLDGVLADFNGHARTVYGLSDSVLKSNKIWDYITQYQKNSNKEWFYDLPLMNDAMQLWDYVKDYSPTILTATGWEYEKVSEQKRKWVEKHFGSDIPVITVPKSEDKAKYATADSILIDDSERSINPWIQNKGIGILHKNSTQTIKDLEKIFNDTP